MDYKPPVSVGDVELSIKAMQRDFDNHFDVSEGHWVGNNPTDIYAFGLDYFISLSDMRLVLLHGVTYKAFNDWYENHMLGDQPINLNTYIMANNLSLLK